MTTELLSSVRCERKGKCKQGTAQGQIVTFPLGLRFTSLANTSGCEADRKGVYHRVVAQIEFTT
jgi:hypothetical protein